MANPIIHWELMVNDIEKAKAFYARLFDWKLEDTPYGEYVMIRTGGGPEGGMMKKPAAAPMPALNVYFQVTSLDQSLKRATELGARVIVPRSEVPGECWFAMFLDPDGIPVGLVEEMRKS